MAVILYIQYFGTKIFFNSNEFVFQQDFIRNKARLDKRKAKIESKQASLNVFNQKSKTSRQQNLNIVENNQFNVASLPMPTEIFGPIQKNPLYQINQNVSIRPDTTPDVLNSMSYRKEGHIQDITCNRIEYIYGVNILLKRSIELV